MVAAAVAMVVDVVAAVVAMVAVVAAAAMVAAAVLLLRLTVAVELLVDSRSGSELLFWESALAELALALALSDGLDMWLWLWLLLAFVLLALLLPPSLKVASLHSWRRRQQQQQVSAWHYLFAVSWMASCAWPPLNFS